MEKNILVTYNNADPKELLDEYFKTLDLMYEGFNFHQDDDEISSGYYSFYFFGTPKEKKELKQMIVENCVDMGITIFYKEEAWNFYDLSDKFLILVDRIDVK